MTTFLLDPATWDLLLDTGGNIAIASDPYATSQDVSSAIKTRLGECWYDTTIGVPYDQIIGQSPPIGLVKAQLVKAALSVPGVTAAVCYLSSLLGRKLSGQVIVTTAAGGTFPVGF